MAERHGQPRVPEPVRDDPDLALGLALSIEEYMEMFPCACSEDAQVCMCDEVGVEG